MDESSSLTHSRDAAELSVSEYGIEPSGGQGFDTGFTGHASSRPGVYRGNPVEGVPRIWGIRKRHLEAIGDAPYGAARIKGLLVGVYNIHLPPEMRDVMVPGEMLATEIGAGYVKGHRIKVQRDLDTAQLISALESVGYPLLVSAKGAFKRGEFTRKRNEQRNMINSLHPEVREEMVASFLREYRPPYTDDSENSRCFADPGTTSMRIERIWEIYNDQWEKSLDLALPDRA